MVRSFLIILMKKQNRTQFQAGVHGRLLFVLLLLSSLCILLPLFFLSCTGCENPLASRKPPQHFRLASWNLEAFFDGQETGTEYSDYTATYWDEVAYKSRLQSLGDALSLWPESQTARNRAGPDIFALLEVENATVLGDLLQGPFARFQYSYSAFATNPASPLGLGILSRFPIVRIRSHSLQTASFSSPRPMLEAEIELPDQSLILFVCHWKSKLGNPQETEAVRRASAGLINRRMIELKKEFPDVKLLFLVAGDLNENADEFERQGGETLTALIPVGAYTAVFPEAASEPRPCIFLASTSEELSEAAEEPAIFFCPWFRAAWQGSYAYQGAWETIDHLLISPAFFDDTGWEYTTFSVLDQAPFVNDTGYPNSFNPRTGKGLSDHLPIMADFYQVQN